MHLRLEEELGRQESLPAQAEADLAQADVLGGRVVAAEHVLEREGRAAEVLPQRRRPGLARELLEVARHGDGGDGLAAHARLPPESQRSQRGGRSGGPGARGCSLVFLGAQQCVAGVAVRVT